MFFFTFSHLLILASSQPGYVPSLSTSPASNSTKPPHLGHFLPKYLSNFKDYQYTEFPPGVKKIHEVCPVNKNSFNYSYTTQKKVFEIVAMLPVDSQTKYFSYHNNSFYSIEKVFPSIDIALEKVDSQSLLPPGYHLNFRYARDDPYDHSKVLNSAIQLVIMNQADIFLGPVADYALAPVLRQCRFWDIPMITPGGMSNEIGVERKTSYPMITRMGITFNSLNDFVLKILRHHNWSKVKALIS